MKVADIRASLAKTLALSLTMESSRSCHHLMRRPQPRAGTESSSTPNFLTIYLMCGGADRNKTDQDGRSPRKF